jgi:predicted RND superfamily exporter protein
VRRGFALDIETFIPIFATPQEWARLRDFNTRFPLSRNVLVSADARYAVLIGMFSRRLPDLAAKDAFRQEFMAAISPLESRSLSQHVLAFPFIEAEGYQALRQDLSRYLVLAVFLILVILLITFRSAAIMLYVLVAEVSGCLLLAGLFLAFHQPVDLHTGILFPLAAGVQLTFVIHYAAALQRFARAHPIHLAATLAFRETALPAALGAVTTIAGLAMLGFSDLGMVHRFGRIGAAAVAGLYLLTFLPPALWGFRPIALPAAPESPPKARPLALLRYRRLVFALFAAASLAAIPFVLRVRSDVRAVEFIRPGHPLRRTLELLNHELGGINIFQLEIEGGKPFAMQTTVLLRYLEDLRLFAAGLDGVSDAYAYSQLFIALNQIWDGSASADGALPDSPMKLSLFSNLINNSPLLFRDAFVSENASSSLMILRSRDMPGAQYLKVLETFLQRAEQTKPPGVTLRPIKGLHSILEADRQIVDNQTRSLAQSLALIALLLALLWRSPRAALWVLACNMPAMLLLFAVMGAFGLPLNSVTVMVAAVLLGIAVDDGIHLVSAFRALRKRGVEPQEATRRALAEKLKPMACTSAILIVFFALLLLASFPPVGHFGLLAAIGLLAAFAGAAILLPAFMGAESHDGSKTIQV